LRMVEVSYAGVPTTRAGMPSKQASTRTFYCVIARTLLCNVSLWLSCARALPVVKFLSEAAQLHMMLSSVSKFPRTPEFEEERTEAALALISYLRRTHRQDLYTKYVIDSLSDVCVAALRGCAGAPPRA
jgi:hypothetical protein